MFPFILSFCSNLIIVDLNPNCGIIPRRKISFSLLLNDDYEGGDFDIEYGHPSKELRHATFRLGKNEAIFFKSDFWHRVNPVKSGIRKSLVGWILGKNY